MSAVFCPLSPVRAALNMSTTPGDVAWPDLADVLAGLQQCVDHPDLSAADSATAASLLAQLADRAAHLPGWLGEVWSQPQIAELEETLGQLRRFPSKLTWHVELAAAAMMDAARGKWGPWERSGDPRLLVSTAHSVAVSYGRGFPTLMRLSGVGHCALLRYGSAELVVRSSGERLVVSRPGADNDMAGFALCGSPSQFVADTGGVAVLCTVGGIWRCGVFSAAAFLRGDPPLTWRPASSDAPPEFLRHALRDTLAGCRGDASSHRGLITADVR